MNDILQNLIDMGNVTAFMNNILVKIENKRKYNKIVKKS